MILYVKFSGLPYLNDKMYDDLVFGDPFRFQLTMFEMHLLIWLSGLVHVHIAYEIANAKITAEICRNSNY